MKRLIRNRWKPSFYFILITAITISLIFIMNILSPFTVLSQTPTPSPSPTNTSTLPAILSISLDFTSPSSPPTSTASPTSSPAADYFDILVRTQVQGINLVDKSGQANVPGEGHLVFYSGIEPDIVPTWPAYRDVGYYISTKTSVLWTNARPDYSVYGVQIVNNNNTPLNPPVYAMIRTYKQRSSSPDRPMITSFRLTTNPPSSPLPSPGPVTRMDTTLNTGVAGFNLVDKFDSPAAPGEGHLIYYEIVDPLITSPEESAFVGGKYSYATTATKFTWLNEVPAYTSYSVQLVNNDNGSLRYPVFAVIKTNVYPGMQLSTLPAQSPTPLPTNVTPSILPGNRNESAVPR